jgi:two-component system sensor histidine kinase KdpD
MSFAAPGPQSSRKRVAGKAGGWLSASHIQLRVLLGARGLRAAGSVKSLLALGSLAAVTVVVSAWFIAHRLGGPFLAALLLCGLTLVAALCIVRSSAPAVAPMPSVEPSGQMRNLYDLTRRTLQMNLHAEPGPQLAALVREIFGLEAVAVFDADLQEVYQAGHWSVDPSETAQNVYHFETSDDDPATGIGRRVVRLGVVPIGSIVVRGETSPLTNSAIAALIAITFDRYRSLANESRIEAERQAEQMRATVLDSLAHAYKTPLTAIRAASSGLCEMGRLSAAQAELVGLIDEQASLLNDLTTRLLTTARLESADAEEAVALHSAPVAVGPLLDEVFAAVGDRSCSANVRIEMADDNLVLGCDQRLISMLLTQYLDNACKYSDADSPITIRAAHSGDEVLFSVHSFGPVISMADRERIFDRYYRAPSSSTGAAGTGIGLSIAKRAAMAHGGSVWVASDEAEGTTFYAAIPAKQFNPTACPVLGDVSAPGLERSTP